MGVLEIDDKELTDKYSKEELDYLFSKVVDFLKKEENKDVLLYSVDIDDAPKEIAEVFTADDSDVEYVNY